jgi:long-chain acyl-CoA synthetase
LSLHGALIASALRHQEKTAFHVPTKGGWTSITYGGFLGMSRGAAALLRECGLSRGGRVAIVAENRPEWCAFYMGALVNGCVAVPMDARLSAGEMRNILEHSGSGAVVFSEGTSVAVGKASEGLGITPLNMDSIDLEKHGSGLSPEANYEEAEDEDLASLLYTSGTTGAPKGVMLTHGNLCSDAEAVREVNLVGSRENVLSALPLHHAYPFMCTFVLPLLVGGEVTYPRGLGGNDIVDAVKANGVTVVVAVPLMLELMRDSIYGRMRELPLPLGRAALWSVGALGWLRERTGLNAGRHFFGRRLGRGFRFFACGGARLEPQVMRDLEALGFTVVEGYGLTETSPIVTFNPLDRRKAGSAGRAVKGAEIRIKDPDEKGVGEVAIKGPMVMRGYYRNEEATAQALRDGWFLSGDLGYFDGEGYLFLTGRAKEVIVLASGKNVYPEDVEKLYLAIPLIKDICVLSREGRLHAAIVPDRGRLAEGDFEEEMRREIKEVSGDIASHMRISGYTLTEGPLPRTPLGKLRRFMVADIVRGKKEGKEEDPALRDEFSQRVLRRLRQLSEEAGPIRSADDLDLDLGLDSLKRLEMVSSLEREFSVKLPDSFAYEVRTVGELVSRLRAGGGEEAGSMDEALWGEPPEEEKKRAGLARHALEWPVTAAAALIQKAIFRLFFRLEARGLENIPEPPFIIAPNHTSYLDGFAIASAVPLATYKNLFFQGFYTYFEGPVKSIFARLSHVIPIDPKERLSSAMRLSHYLLGQGKALCIFPEGQRSFDGELGQFKKGVGMLALRLDVPVVPARISGAFEALPRGRFLPRPVKITVTFGEALRPSSLTYPLGAGGEGPEQRFAEMVRDRVRDL